MMILKIGNLYQVKSKSYYEYDIEPVIDIYDLSSYKCISKLEDKNMFIFLGSKKIREYATAIKILKMNIVGYLYKEDLEDYFKTINMENKNETIC